jgi:hypothetical protein
VGLRLLAEVCEAIIIISLPARTVSRLGIALGHVKRMREHQSTTACLVGFLDTVIAHECSKMLLPIWSRFELVYVLRGVVLYRTLPR